MLTNIEQAVMNLPCKDILKEYVSECGIQARLRCLVHKIRLNIDAAESPFVIIMRPQTEIVHISYICTAFLMGSAVCNSLHKPRGT